MGAEFFEPVATKSPLATYGFETHGVIEGAELAFSSPLSASQLDNNFDLAYTNFNAFSIIDNGTAPGVDEPTKFAFDYGNRPLPNKVLKHTQSKTQLPTGGENVQKVF